MLDGLSLDQVRIFIAAVDEGSFSAAGRKLNRAQSAVSQALANLESQCGVTLFHRGGRFPRLTDAGRVLLAEARTIAAGMDLFKARAKALAGGLEAELSAVVDVLFPTDLLTCAVAGFQAEFPGVPLRLYVEALGAVLQPVLDGRCALGIMGSLPDVLPQMVSERLCSIEMVFVAAPSHPLARHIGPVPAALLAEHVQLVLTDRSTLSAGRDFSVYSPRTWRLADLGAKHDFLRAGLGWGGMPRHAVATDLAQGVLFPIAVEDAISGAITMPMSAVFRADSPPGPAGRWFIERLKQQADPV